MHARFLAILDREAVKYAAHLASLRARPVPRGNPKASVLARRAVPREPLDEPEDWDRMPRRVESPLVDARRRLDDELDTQV